jgi:hypothetical protein
MVTKKRSHPRQQPLPNVPTCLEDHTPRTISLILVPEPDVITSRLVPHPRGIAGPRGEHFRTKRKSADFLADTQRLPDGVDVARASLAHP